MSSLVRAVIVSQGSELTRGEVQDTNARFLAAAAERTAEAESDLVELKRGTWATDRVG